MQSQYTFEKKLLCDAMIKRYFEGHSLAKVNSSMSCTLPADLKDVLKFVEESKGEFAHNDCEIKSSQLGGLGVFAQHDIKADTLLLRVPKSAIFSASNSTIANLLLEEELDGILATIIAFVYEITIFKESSHWYKYLKSVKICNPDGKLVLPPNHWSSEEKGLLRGTTLETLHDGLKPEDEVREGFEVAVSLAKKWSKEFGLRIPIDFFEVDGKKDDLLYLRFVAIAYAISSRIFEIDAFHESGLVPIADLFNHHAAEPDVHFNSLYDVCDLCGEAGMCKHLMAETLTKQESLVKTEGDSQIQDSDSDQDVHTSHNDDENGDENEDENYDEDGRENDDEDGRENDDEDGHENDDENDDENEGENDDSEDDACVEMVLVNGVHAGAEIFNSYGELSNSVLLARYGFCIPENPADVVHLGREIMGWAKTNKKFRERISWWSKVGYESFRNWYDAARNEKDDEKEDEGDAESLTPWLSDVYVDFGGLPSITLRAFLSMLSLNHKDWKRLHEDIEQEKVSSLGMLHNRVNHEYKKILSEILLLKESSQFNGELKTRVGETHYSSRLTNIKILLQAEKDIIKRARTFLP